MYPDPDVPGAMRYWDGSKWHDSGAQPPVSAAQPAVPTVRRYMEYKVLTQKDRYFGGKFNPQAVEAVLNSFAREGWHVKAITSASFQTALSGNREEMIVVLEREILG